jgi:SAM-dependent methyltransferase
MFSLDHLHAIRAAELRRIAAYLPPGGRILELGAGTGGQARALTALGYRVTAVDLPDSSYRAHRVFDVIDFDGMRLPFRNRSFDVVFSSNVLEHVRHPGEIYPEIKRVLVPAGVCVHVIPSTSWRLWTTVAALPDTLSRLRSMAPQLTPRSGTAGELSRIWRLAVEAARVALRPFAFTRHGEVGNALTELWTFSRRRWVRHFRHHGFTTLRAESTGIFYTGYMYFGPSWDLRRRERLARLMGSACNLYVVRPAPAPDAARSSPQYRPVDIGELRPDSRRNELVEHPSPTRLSM